MSLQSSFGNVKRAIIACNGFPHGKNYDYYSTFPVFTDIKELEKRKLVKCMQQILNLAQMTQNMARRNDDEKFDLVTEANDYFLDLAVCTFVNFAI